MSNETKNPEVTVNPEVAAAVATEATAEAATPSSAQAILEQHGMDAAKAFDVANKLGVETVEDLAMCTEADLVEAGMKPIPARKMLASMKPATEPAPAAAKVAPMPAMMAADYGSLLPVAPTDESWLSALKAGGVLKVDTDSYISAIRVVYADRAGLYDLPEKLANAMEAYAEEADEPVPAEFFTLRKQVTRRNYSEIFGAIDGLDGNYVTDRRRQEFLRRVRGELQPQIRDAYVALNAWYEAVRATNSDPSYLLTAMTGVISGTGVAGMAALPPFDNVTDASETLKDAINHVFRGMGTVVASALAYDARQTSALLDNPQLPKMLGVANRDQMLKKLGANVSPNYVRQEANMVRFVLSYVRFSDNIAVGEESRYLMALWQLGNQINWDALGASDGVRSLGGNVRL